MHSGCLVAETKNKGGRPRGQNPTLSMRKTLDAKPEQWSRWDKATDEAGLESRSEWMRRVLDEAAEKLLGSSA